MAALFFIFVAQKYKKIAINNIQFLTPKLPSNDKIFTPAIIVIFSIHGKSTSPGKQGQVVNEYS